MLEILLMIALTRKIGLIVEGKGRKSGGYKALVVLFWFGGEILGFVVGSALELGSAAYLVALLGAAAGALVAYSIANAAKPLDAVDDEAAAVFD
jgi:uncharacterized membrane protein